MTDAIVAEDVTQSFWELCQSAALIMKKFFPSDFPKLIFLSKQESITLNSDNLSKDPTIKLITSHSSNNAIIIISVLPAVPLYFSFLLPLFLYSKQKLN